MKDQSKKPTDKQVMEKLLKGHVVTDKTAKAVSLRRLHEWLGTNAHLTWYMGEYPERCKHERTIGPIKYIDPVFDTRTGDIFTLSTRGWGNYKVDFREEFDGDILDLLEYKIKNGLTIDKGEDDG